MYKHTPIAGDRAIRLLVLQPALLSTAPICITLQEASLERLPDYEALSYAWESQTPDCPVVCYGLQLLITKNCHDALRRLRNKRKQRVLWIDSICIDQSCVKEREKQVQLMGDVYSDARRVLIWLGESNELSDFLMSHLQSRHKIRATDNLILARLKKPRLKLKRHMANAKLKHIKRYNTTVLDSYFSILNRSWFSRLWAVQEYVLSKDAAFVCGGMLLNTHIFFLELEGLSVALVVDNPGVINVKDIANFWHTILGIQTFVDFYGPLKDRFASHDGIAPATFTDVLVHTRQAKATDPKDKVYGIYGILNRLGATLSLPCYEDPIEKIYADATRNAIEYDQSLDILLEAVGGSSSSLLASWVADWNVPATHGLARVINASYISYKASQTSESTFWFLDQSNSLAVRGRVVSDITSCSTRNISDMFELKSYDGVDSYVRDALRDWVIFTKAARSYPSGETWEDVLRFTFRSFADGEEMNDPQEKLIVSKWIEALFLGRSETNSLMSSVKNPAGFSSVQERVIGRSSASTSSEDLAVAKAIQQCPGVAEWEINGLKLSSGLRLFRTASGHLGKGLASLQEGDVVLLISGVPLPLIARASGETFRLIGPAYVYGMVNGEFWPEDESELVDIIIS